MKRKQLLTTLTGLFGVIGLAGGILLPPIGQSPNSHDQIRNDLVDKTSAINLSNINNCGKDKCYIVDGWEPVIIANSRVFLEHPLDFNSSGIRWNENHRLDVKSYHYTTDDLHLIDLTIRSRLGILEVGSRKTTSHEYKIYAIPLKIIRTDGKPIFGKNIQYYSLNGSITITFYESILQSDTGIVWAHGYDQNYEMYLYTDEEKLNKLTAEEKVAFDVRKVGKKSAMDVFHIKKISLSRHEIISGGSLNLVPSSLKNKLDINTLVKAIDNLDTRFYKKTHALLTSPTFKFKDYNLTPETVGIDPLTNIPYKIKKHRVLKITDGDTFDSQRIKGMDTPEKAIAPYRLGDNLLQYAFAEEATKMAGSLLRSQPHESVYLHTSGKDAYNRDLVYVLLPGKENETKRTSFVARMIASGLAVIAIHDDDFTNHRYDQFMQEAMMAQLWAIYNRVGMFKTSEWDRHFQTLNKVIKDANIIRNINYTYQVHHMGLLYPQGREWSFNNDRLSVSNLNEVTLDSYKNGFEEALNSKTLLKILNFVNHQELTSRQTSSSISL